MESSMLGIATILNPEQKDTTMGMSRQLEIEDHLNWFITKLVKISERL